MRNSFGINIIPSNDKARLRALYDYNLLDTPPEKSFDDITALMVKVFGVPIALISLVDAERVFFKSNHGMGRTTETERGVSLCSLGILSDEPTVFTDPVVEPCLLANPLVQGNFGLKFYAGVPLKTSDGFNIGTVCLVDKQKREFSKAEEKMFQGFADIVMNEIIMRRDASSQLGNKDREIITIDSDLARTSQELDDIRSEAQRFEYLSNHHFQEPLRKIELFSNMLLDEKKRYDSARSSTFAEKIRKFTQDLRSLLENFSRFSSLNSPSCKTAGIDLNLLIDRSRQVLKLEFPEISFDIRTDHLPVLTGIEDQIQQLFTELLRNAIRFSDAAKPIVVDIQFSMVSDAEKKQYRRLHSQKEYVRIAVKDEGDGIDEKYALNIFSLFYTLSDQKPSGIEGAGLAFCKRIVQNHEGIIYMESVPEAGSTFYVLLPVN